jgi:LacI family transcriptional regulator
MDETGEDYMKKVTIQDVAKALNLSRNTVAKALVNSTTVSYETRCIVIEKAYEMGYSKLSSVVMNEFKLRNKVSDTKTIVVLTRREISVFWNSIIMGISDELNKFGCKLQFNFISDQDEQDLILPLDLQTEVSGIIILSVFAQEYIEQITKGNIPIIFLDAPKDLESVTQFGDVVIVEGNNSIRKITWELITQGMRDIGFIGDISYCRTIHDRYLGYVNALEQAGIAKDDTIIATYHAKHRFYRTEEVEAALESFSRIPEAIVCANDDIALDVIRCLKNRGLSVPQDVAVTGYDNVEGMAQVEPILTTVRVGNQRLGRRLVQQLIWRINNPNFPPEVIYVGAEVIFRQSSVKSQR